MRITNSDLGIPKKENRKGDHHSTEYFEADDDKDKIKIKKEDSEDNRLNTFNSEATVGKLGTLKLRLVIKTLLNIKHYTILSIIISKILQQATERAFIQQ